MKNSRKRKVLNTLVKKYLEDLVIEVPDIHNNPKLRNEIISTAKTNLDSKAHKYIIMYMMDRIKTQAVTIDDEESIDVKKGQILGLKLYEENLKRFAVLSPIPEKNADSD